MAGRSWSHLPAWGRCWGWGVPPRTAGGAGGSTPEWKMRTGSWNLMGTSQNNVTCLFIHTSGHMSPIIVSDHEDRFLLSWPVAEGKACGWIIDSFIPLCCFSFKVLVLLTVTVLLTWMLEQKRVFSYYDNAKNLCCEILFCSHQKWHLQMPRLAHMVKQ